MPAHSPPDTAPPTTTPRATATWLLVALAAVWTAYFLKAVLVPIAFALLLKFLLSPLMRWLQRRRIPKPIAAIGIVTTGIAVVVGILLALAPAAMHWTEELPARLERIEGRALEVMKPVALIGEVTSKVGERVEDLTVAAQGSSAEQPTVVRIEEQGWLATAFNAARETMLGFGLTVTLLLLLLLNDGLVLSKLEASGGDAERRWAEALREIERRSSTYVGSMLLIHSLMGGCIAIVCLLCGMPNPWLWGIVGALGDAIPFVGPLIVTGILSVVGLTTFDAIGQAMIPSIAYVILNVLESNLLTPALLGRWLSLSPVAIFVGMALTGFVWGAPGLVLAVPLLVVLRIISDYVPSWRAMQILIDGRAKEQNPAGAQPASTAKLPASPERGPRVA